ncbi:unnamed protein product [Peronospora belbahrii]|uniref:Uncharacterized protein n=1 Tax=Peronospora belbahrii TaxID=622444 RepID=A0ABN8D841_9STRA|nr:unnamed protein product [Peronospora belbahrii]
MVEMDTLLHQYELFSRKIVSWSHEFVQQMEKQEVEKVVNDVIMNVEVRTFQDELKTAQMELQWAFWFEKDANNCVQKLFKDIQETEMFESMEKQLMNDRVVELETQLAQKRAVEKEKEMELSTLRAHQEQLMESGCMKFHPEEEIKTLIAEKKAMDVEVEQLKERVKQQTQELTYVEKERADLKAETQKLVQEARQLREEQETREYQAMIQQNAKQEEEIKKLQAMLEDAKTTEAKTIGALEMAEKVREKNTQHKEELKILYAKFSSAMDSVSEKTVRLEELEQTVKDSESIRKQNKLFEKQVAQLQQEKAELSAARYREKEDMSEELVIVQQQLTEMNELASQQKKLASKLQSEITELKDENEALKQQVKQEDQSVGQSSKDNDEGNTDIDNDLVVQVAEKEALQMFVQRYYAAAEEKCRRLLEKVSELELQCKRTQEQTKESCSLLRMCTQVDACDESLRASLHDVMARLDSLT